MKKILLFLLIFIFILSINFSFAQDNDVLTESVDDEGFLGDSIDIYVSNDGSDSSGDGSIEKPYQTLNYTISRASNNSNIYLKSGTYNSTGYDIKNKSISITGIGDVTVDGLNGKISQNIFKVQNDSILVLNNIKFINGYCDLNGETTSCITNYGQLYIFNSTFENFKTSIGVIKNENYLYINNVSTSNLDNSELYSAPYKYNMQIQFIYNVAYCDVYNSHISTSYNNKNMTLTNSYIERFVSNKDYLNQSSYAYFYNSNVNLITVSNCEMLIFNNTYINCKFYLDATHGMFSTTHTFEYSNIIWDNVTVSECSNIYASYYLKMDYCNIDVISSSISTSILFFYSNATISYSAILDRITASGVSNVNVNYNWWGNNKGHRAFCTEYSKLTSTYWIVMIADGEVNSSFKIDLTKYTNGLDIWSLDNPSKVNSRLAKFESETGTLTKNSGYLKNGILETELVDNNADTIVYATVDNQILRIVVGEGNSDFSWYISDTEGNDYFCDGSLENPYKTLKKAVSKVVSGNKIYVLPGYYTLSWNANIKISKNITVIGIGNATLSRPNARCIFSVDAKGILNIENITFTQASTDGYTNELIHLIGGDVNIKNSIFYNITTKGIVFSDQSEYVNINNITVTNVGGPLVAGCSTCISVLNSGFSRGSPYSYYNSFYSYLFPVASDLYIVNCTVDKYIGGFIVLNPPRTTSKDDAKVYIYNSTFSRIEPQYYGYNQIIIAASNSKYQPGWAYVENCIFSNNIGNLISADIITNCTFINNTRIRYPDSNGNIYYSENYPKAVIYAKLINNSYFYNNSFITKSYEDMVIHGDEVYYSTFIHNSAGFGGALSNSNEVHYCIFVNNTADYSGNDIFVYKGDLNCSSNWWGSNQKPNSTAITVFIGTLTLDDWVILTMDYKNHTIFAYLDNVIDNNGNIHPLDHTLPSRKVNFSAEEGELNPNTSYLINNQASTKLTKSTSQDFDVFAQVDNQITSLTVYNNSTQIVMKNLMIHGKDVLFNISLINVNGYRISNQDLSVLITHNNSVIDSFILTTNSNGDTSFNVDYPIGTYQVNVYYSGNGYFEKSNSSAIITVSSIKTVIKSYNQTYSGKNNKFYAILADTTERYLLNKNLILKIYDLKDNLVNTVETKTSQGGRADVLLSLDVGSYKMRWDYLGDEWYEKSYFESYVTINPIQTVIILPNSTIYGKGSDYEFNFKDNYGTLISDEIINLKISKGNESKEFAITTKNGVGSITINLLPGTYDLQATYQGDIIYSSSQSSATLNVQPIFVTINHNSYQSIPLNGVFTVILKDMYGNKVSGENVTIELINKDIQKVYSAVSDGSGEANFKIDASEGVYFTLINYNGNTWYSSSFSAATLEINPKTIINPVYINGSDLIQYYGENKYYLINFNDTNAYSLEGKIINVVISSDDWSKSYDIESNVLGEARIQITLEPGIYNITYNYKNEYYGLFGENSSNILVYKMPTSLIASNMILNQGEPRNLEIKLVNKNGSPLSNLPINIHIDGKEYNVSTNQKGIAKLLLYLDLGMHNVSYSFNNKNYVPSKGNITILVVDEAKTATNLLGEDVYSREDLLINYSVVLTDLLNNPISSSEVNLNIIDSQGNNVSSYKAYTDLNGLATFNFNLEYGNYLANIYYNGNDINLGSSTTNYFYIKALQNYTETILFGNDLEIVNGENNYYSVVLTTLSGTFLNNQEIEFIVKGKSYFATTDENGRAYLKVPFNPGSYEIISKFNGSDNLTKSIVHNYILIHGDLINLYSQNVVKAYNNGTHYYVALYDANNEPLANKTITFYINNNTYQDITNKDGFACFEVWLNPGTYIINVTYQGDYPDEYISVINNITVLPTIIGENLSIYYNTNITFSILLFDYSAEPLENTDVIITINGVKYISKTNSGLAKWKLNLNCGDYNVVCINPLTSEKIICKITIKSTLSTKNLVTYYKGSSKFQARFKDKSGNLLKNSKVIFIINKKVYTKITNYEGFVSLNIGLKPGKYTIISYNLKTGEMKKNQITIKTLIISKNKKVKHAKKTNFKVKILNYEGKIAKKVTIKFKIKENTYKIKTNNKGFAKLNIKLKKGRYTVTTSYSGLSVKNTITVK